MRLGTVITPGPQLKLPDTSIYIYSRPELLCPFAFAIHSFPVVDELTIAKADSKPDYVYFPEGPSKAKNHGQWVK